MPKGYYTVLQRHQELVQIVTPNEVVVVMTINEFFMIRSLSQCYMAELAASHCRSVVMMRRALYDKLLYIEQQYSSGNALRTAHEGHVVPGL